MRFYDFFASFSSCGIVPSIFCWHFFYCQQYFYCSFFSLWKLYSSSRRIKTFFCKLYSLLNGIFKKPKRKIGTEDRAIKKLIWMLIGYHILSKYEIFKFITLVSVILNLKFIFSKKATKIGKIFSIDLTLTK